MNFQNRHIRITRQPSEIPVRYRYAVEGRHAEVIKGEGFDKNHIIWPEVEINGCKGESIVLMISCVTTDKPYRIHPHNLVGPSCKDYGVCTIEDTCSTDVTRIEIKNIGVQCVKRTEIESSIEIRKKKNIDPFQGGFNHAKDNNIDLNSVRLCFQVILKKTSGNFESLKPIVSNVVYDVKALCVLKIHRLCKCSDYAKGGASIILLCTKVKRDSIRIKFFQEENWEAYGEFEHTDVHKQFAICFKVPPYKNQNITDPVRAFVQLESTGRNEKGEKTLLHSVPLEFTFIPNPDAVKRKQARIYQKAKEASIIPELINIECFNFPSTSQFDSTYNPMSLLGSPENIVHNSNQFGSLLNSITPTTTTTNPFQSTNLFQEPQNTLITSPSPQQELKMIQNDNSLQTNFFSSNTSSPNHYSVLSNQLGSLRNSITPTTTATNPFQSTNLFQAPQNRLITSPSPQQELKMIQNMPESNNYNSPTSPENCQQLPFQSWNQFQENTPISPMSQTSNFSPNVLPNYCANELIPNNALEQMQLNTSNYAHHNGFNAATNFNDNNLTNLATNFMNFSPDLSPNNLHALLTSNEQNTIPTGNFVLNSHNKEFLNQFSSISNDFI